MGRGWLLLTTMVLLGAGWATAANAADYLYVGGGSGVLPYSIAADGSITPVTCPQNVANCGPGLVWGVAASPNGKFVFGTLIGTGSSNGSVAPFSVNADGSLSQVTCTGGSASCTTQHQPEGLAVSPDGAYLYVANYNSNSISQFMIGPAGKLTPLTPATVATPSNAQTLAITPDGRFLYAANGAEVSTFAVGTGGTLTAMTCSGPFCSSSGVGAGPLAVSPSGRFLYVMTDASGAIVPLAIAADGSLSAVTCSTGCAGNASGGYELAIAPDGKHLYATDGSTQPQTLLPYAINADGSLSQLSCPITACDTGAGTEPIGLTLDPAGNALYAVDYANNKLLPFSLDTSGLPSPLACSPAGNCAVPNQAAYLQRIAALPDQAPTAALTATPAVAMSATSFDASASTAANGGHVASWSWSFGDGTTLTSSVPAVQHTYAAPGTYTATVTVADQDGCSSALIFTGQTAYCNGGPSATTTVTFTVVAKGSPPPPVTSTSTPRLTSVSQTNPVWREGSHLATIARHRHPVGTKFRFTLNEPARITLTFTQARPGRRVRKRCVAQSGHNRHQHRCTRRMTVGSLTFSAQAGARTVSFQGRLSRSRRLTLGRYSVTISATDASGHRTSAAPLKFTIVAS